MGGLIGYIDGGTISVHDCHAVADVTATDSYAGILIGNVEADLAGEIACCSATGTVTGGAGVGGLVGQLRRALDLYVRDCMVTDAVVHGNKENVGGLSGMSKCNVERCFVKDVEVIQDAPNESKQHCASLLSGWQNIAGSVISNNVVFSGTVTANNDVNSHRITQYQKGRADKQLCQRNDNRQRQHPPTTEQTNAVRAITIRARADEARALYHSQF